MHSVYSVDISNMYSPQQYHNISDRSLKVACQSLPVNSSFGLLFPIHVIVPHNNIRSTVFKDVLSCESLVRIRGVGIMEISDFILRCRAVGPRCVTAKTLHKNVC
jgi:hypothetical protein